MLNKKIAVFSIVISLITETTVHEKINEAIKNFSYEPECTEVVKKVLKKFQQGSKVKIPSTFRMRASSILPTVRFSTTKSLEYDQTLEAIEQDNAAIKIYTDDDLRLKITLQWNLASLIFHPSEASIIGKQQSAEKMKLELTERVMEIYHRRKKLQILIYLMKDMVKEQKLVQWMIELKTLTSMLNTLTDGWFKEEILRGSAMKNRKANPEN